MSSNLAIDFSSIPNSTTGLPKNVAKKSNNIYLKYSTCLELIDYVFNELLIKYYEDFDPKNAFEKIRQLSDCLDLQIKKDRKSIRFFFLKNKKNLSNVSSVWYDNYLKINYQSKGISSYNQVIGLIFAYLKK